MPVTLPLLPLKNAEGTDHALDTLARLAAHVEPILARRPQWRVGQLREFYPNNDNLLGLNVNAGAAIYVRLRPAGSPPKPPKKGNSKFGDLSSSPTWLSYETVLDTMLHELAHNTHGNHGDAFHKLWDVLRQECEEDMSKGRCGDPVKYGGSLHSRNSVAISGVHVFAPSGRGGLGAGPSAATFGGEGKRLSDGLSGGRPTSAGARRAAAAAAADKRARNQELMGGSSASSGGHRLGGRPPEELLAAVAGGGSPQPQSLWGTSSWSGMRQRGNTATIGVGGPSAHAGSAIDLTGDEIEAAAAATSTRSSRGGHTQLKPLVPPASAAAAARRALHAAAAERRIRALEDAACPSGCADGEDGDDDVIEVKAAPPAAGIKRRRGDEAGTSPAAPTVLEILDSSPELPARTGAVTRSAPTAASAAAAELPPPSASRRKPPRVIEVVELDVDGNVVGAFVEVD